MSSAPIRPWSVTPEAAIAAVTKVHSGSGKLEVVSKVLVESLQDVATLYTPGVATLVREVQRDPARVDELTNRGNTIAVVTDGTAVLGFGRTGPLPAVPVMEGKAIMFKLLAGLDAVPLCLDVNDPDRLVDHIAALEPSFAGFNLEDISTPHCFSTVSELERRLSVPVFHDDQYGTATVIVAGVMNALKHVGKKPGDVRVVINGAGAAGTAATNLILAFGVGDVVCCDRHGILTAGREQPSPHMTALAARTNRERLSGQLADAVRGADIFIGLSTGGILTESHVQSMARDPIVFACANPEPEIMPDLALHAGAAVAGSGRFDFPNQCNNVLAFPGIMRGAIETRTVRISEGICLAAARAIAGHVPDAALRFDNVLPTPLDPALCPVVAEAVAAEAIKEGLAQRSPAPGTVANIVRELSVITGKQQRFLAELAADLGSSR